MSIYSCTYILALPPFLHTKQAWGSLSEVPERPAAGVGVSWTRDQRLDTPLDIRLGPQVMDHTTGYTGYEPLSS